MEMVVPYSLYLMLFSLMAAAQNPCKPKSGYEMFTTLDESTAELGKEVFYVDIPGDSTEVVLSADYNDFFAFNTSTRWVWVNGTIDAEVSTDSQKLTILCRELTSQGTVDISVTIIITDSNDNGPVFTNNVYTISISEMTEIGTTIETDILATDADKDYNNNLLSYAILPGLYSDYFLIFNPLKPIPTLMKTLDFETLPRFSITMMAEDRPSSGPQFNATCEVIIKVEDGDDQVPVFNSSVYQAFITSTTSANSIVRVQPDILAFDPDTSLNASVEYSFHEPKSQSGQVLVIDKETAQVTLTRLPRSRETYLLLQATQVDNPYRYGVALLALRVQGSNVNAPVFMRDNSQVTRTEAFPVGEVITTVVAMDADPGSVIHYSMDEASKARFSINEDTGDIKLLSALSYMEKPQHVIKITASDGTLQSTGQVTIRVSPTKNKPPVILTTNFNVSIARRTGVAVIDIDAQDDDEAAGVLKYELLTHANLFAIDSQGKITVSAKEGQLNQNVYEIAVLVSNDGQPSYSTAAAVTVNFPQLRPPVTSAQMSESDSLLPIVLGAVGAVLLVVVVILVVYICRRRLRDKEHLDRAKKQLPSQDAKALAFKKQGTLGRRSQVNVEFGEEPSDGDTTIQENPLSSATKGGYFNFGQVHSDLEGDYTDNDMSEIHVETSVTPYAGSPGSNDDNNNDNIYNNSQLSEESEDYGPSEKQAITSFFRNGSLSTFRDSSDSDASINVSPTESHDSKKNLVLPSLLAKSRVPEEELSNGGHAVSSSDAANLNPDASVVPSSQKQELTVYF